MGAHEGFGEVENQIIVACNEYPPDFEKIERLMEQCADLNVTAADSDGENMLANIICWYPEMDRLHVCCEPYMDTSCEECSLDYPDYDGRYLPRIVDLFLKHGFDVHRDEGRAGGRCLLNLLFALKDPYVLEAEKRLLAAGADPTVQVDGESVLSAYTGECAFRFCEREYREESLYHTMYEIARAASRGKDYRSIEFFETCIGRRIDKIEMACAGEVPVRPIHSAGFPVPRYRNCFTMPIVFHCEGKPLCISRYVEMLVDPNVPEAAQTVCNLEHAFPGCVGRRIAAIEFEGKDGEAERKCAKAPHVQIRLDNGRRIQFFFDRSRRGGESEGIAHFKVI